MALDVELPDPPDLTNRGVPSVFEEVDEVGPGADLRREELEVALRDGAWREAFEEWAEYTDIEDAEFRALVDRGLVGELDVFWDPGDERLRFEVPTVPPSVGSDPDRLENELTDLARILVGELAEGYLDWNGIEAEDYVWDVEGFDEPSSGG